MAWDAANTSKLENNQRNWDARTPVHVASQFYDLAGVRAGVNRLAEFERAELGELGSRTVAHLQCHIGTDTVCLAKAGARVVGLDFSAASVAAARELAEDAGLDVQYVQAEVYDAVEALGPSRFDLVYTGKGSLVWLPDLDRWAAVVAELLRPGGELYLVEFHPLVWSLSGNSPGNDLRIGRDYLSTGVAVEVQGDVTYTDGPAVDDSPSTIYNWVHDLGEIVSAVARAGLRVVRLAEHDVIDSQALPGLRRGEDGWWRLPNGAPRVPLMYSLCAIRA